MKFKRLAYVLSLFLGGILYVAYNEEQKLKFSWWRVIFVLGLLGVIALGGSFFYIRSFYDSQFTGKTDGCAVIFGAAVWRGDVPSHALYDRTESALDLYAKNQVSCLILSGGESTYGAHEVSVMKNMALERGVREQDIFYDYGGKNTLATLQFAKLSKKHLVFVSNDFHLARINMIAKKLGIKDYHLHVAKYHKGRYLKEAYFTLREVFGVLLFTFLYWN